MDISKIKRIAVLGAGNGGFMSAFDFSEMGFEVRIFDTLEGKLDGLREAGNKIELLDIDLVSTGRFAQVAVVADKAQEAVVGAEVIVNPVPFFAVKHYAEAAAPYITDGQVIICLGKGGASLVWKKALDEVGNKSKVYLVDCNTLPYGTSRIGDRQVRLESRTLNLMFASFPAKYLDEVWPVLELLYPAKHGYELRRGQNVIDTILVDYNAITHTPPMICNAARVYSGDPDFHLFGPEECPAPVVNLVEKVDRERMAIGEKLGLKQYTLEEEIKMVKWNRDGVDVVLPIYEALHTPFLEVCEGPFKLDARHLTEDIPYGLVTYSSLGRLVGVPTPFCDAITTIAEGLLGKDFYKMGRKVEDLGLSPDWTVEQVKNFLYEGTI